MKVYVVGIGMTNFEKPGKREAEGRGDYPEMVLEACQEAFYDANLEYANVEKAFVGYCYGESCCGQKALYQLGMTGIPIINVNNNCATGSSALYLAYEMVAGSRSDCVLALGFEKMEKGSLGAKYTDRPNPVENHLTAMIEKYGYESGPPTAQMFGNAGREHMQRYGTTTEHFGKIAQKNHSHSKNNPKSQFKDEYSIEQINGAPCIHDPLTKLHCCPTSDGAAAVIIVSERFLTFRPDLWKSAVEISAMSLVTDLPSAFSDNAMSIVGYDMTKLAASNVYTNANIHPDDIDVIELHDCFSANELITYEALGLCAEGKAGEFIDRGDNTYGGKYVINPSGGLISKGHPLGATGIAQCVELCLHLRDIAGKRQVKDAHVGLQHNLGLGGACVVAAYKRVQNPIAKGALPKLRGGAVELDIGNIQEDAFKCKILFTQISQEMSKPENRDWVSNVNATYKFKVSSKLDGKPISGIWFVNSKAETVPFVKFGHDDKAECVISAKDDDLFNVMSGKLDSMKAFMAGKLKVTGNTMLAMKLKQFQVKLDQHEVSQQTNALSSKPDVTLKSDKFFSEIREGLKVDESLAKKVNASFQFVIKPSESNSAPKVWIVDAKSSPPLVEEATERRISDCTIECSDDILHDIMAGKLNPQIAFMKKMLKVTGNVMLASKLTQFSAKSKSKL